MEGPSSIEIATLAVGVITALVTTAYVILTYGLLRSTRRQIEFTHMPTLTARIVADEDPMRLVVENRSDAPASAVQLVVVLELDDESSPATEFATEYLKPQYRQAFSPGPLLTRDGSYGVREILRYPVFAQRRAVDVCLDLPNIGWCVYVWMQYLGPTGRAYGQLLTFLGSPGGQFQLESAEPDVPTPQERVVPVAEMRLPLRWKLVRWRGRSNEWVRHWRDVRVRFPSYIRDDFGAGRLLSRSVIPVGYLEAASLDTTDRGVWSDR